MCDGVDEPLRVDEFDAGVAASEMNPGGTSLVDVRKKVSAT